MKTGATALSSFDWPGIAAARKQYHFRGFIPSQILNFASYDKLTNTGGSNGATMRFAPEGDHGANAGLKAARDFLEPVKGNIRSSHQCLKA